MPRFYDPKDYEGGLSCMDCGGIFLEGQPIAERLIGVDTCGDLAYLPGADASPDDPLFYLDIICVPCDLGKKGV